MNPRLAQTLADGRIADLRRDRRDIRTDDDRHLARIRIVRPLVRFLGH